MPEGPVRRVPISGGSASFVSESVLSFVRDIFAYFRILGAMIAREAQSRIAAPFASIIELMEPVLLIGVTTAAWWMLDRRNYSPLGGSPILFYSTGFFFVYLFIHQSNKMKRAVEAPIRRFPVERRLDAIFIHFLFKLIEYGILGLLLFGSIAIFVNSQAIPYDWFSILGAVAAVTALAFGWGMVNLVAARASKFWAAVYAPLNRSFVIFSGVVFLVDFLSPATRYVLSFVPLVHALSLFRLGFYPNQPQLVLDRGYLAFCAITAVAIGLVVERASRRME